MQRTSLATPASALVLALACAGGAAVAQQREYTVPGAQAQINSYGLYKTKYYASEQALSCAGFHGLTPTLKGGGSQVIEQVPHPAVKWAAEVDMKPRAAGDAGRLCGYLSQPDVQKWYATNFRLSMPQPRR